jgi:hypothetical protein
LQLVLSVRETVAVNPLNKETASAAEKPNNILRNHVEQALMFIPATLILATYLSQETMKLIFILCFIWAIARVIFQYG